MTHAAHDSFFKSVLSQPEYASQLFRQHLPEAMAAEIDWSTLKLEPGSYIDEELRETHTDLLFSVRKGEETVLFYLLLEHQSSDDPWMAFRIVRYEVRILERHRREHPDQPLPIIFPLVVSHAVTGWTSPLWLHDLFQPSPASTGIGDGVLNGRYYVEDLAHVTDEELRARAIGAMLRISLALLRDARDGEALERHPEEWADAYRAVKSSANGTEAIARVFRYVLILLPDPVQFSRFGANLRKAIPEAEQDLMEAQNAAQHFRNEGQIQGRIQGRVEGQIEGQIQLIERLLTRRFGTLSSEHQLRLRSANATQLERYGDQLLTAQSIDEVFAES
jgi:predicted transposase/invertase (TIGR01784 family)